MFCPNHTVSMPTHVGLKRSTTAPICCAIFSKRCESSIDAGVDTQPYARHRSRDPSCSTMPQPVFARPGSMPNMIRWSPRTPALSLSENNALDSNAVAAHAVDAAKAKPFQLERPHVEQSGSQACRINAGLYKLCQRRRMLPANPLPSSFLYDILLSCYLSTKIAIGKPVVSSAITSERCRPKLPVSSDSARE